MASIEFEEARQRVGTLGISALLACAGGYLDGFTYVGHGHVFANAMTGNVVLLGINCLSGSFRTGFRHLPAILAFVAGICVSQAAQLQAKRRGAGAPYAEVLFLEIGVLFVLSLLPASTADILFTVSIAFAASVQVQTFREVNGHSYNSTFTTGNLRTLCEAAVAWFLEGHNRAAAGIVKDFSLICLAFLAGAAAGGYATQAFGNRALWCDVVLLTLLALRVRLHLSSPSVGRRKDHPLPDGAEEISASRGS